MAYVISDACVSCGSCESECPVEAISQGETQYEIDPDTCVDCGSCAAACPTDAISAEYIIDQKPARLPDEQFFMVCHFFFSNVLCSSFFSLFLVGGIYFP